MVLWKAQGSDSDPLGAEVLEGDSDVNVNEGSVLGREFVIPVYV